MKLFSVVATIVCVLFISEKAYGALPNCSATLECTNVTNAYCAAAGQLCQCNNTYHLNVEANDCIADIQPGATCLNTTECVNNATCKNATGVTTMQCTCDAGFHTMPGACALDIQLGGNCTSHGNDTECADNALCVNVTGAPSPVCTCKSGFHNTSGACVIDVQLGGNCTFHGDDTECADNALCVTVTGAPSPVCTCKPGFHNTSGACVIDVQLGGNCTSHGDDTECENNAMCVNVTGAPSPVCTCKSGFHNTSGACVIDIGAGGVCTVDKANTECVDHATCKNSSQPTPGLKCTCDEDYHPANSGTGNVTCAADNCQDSVNKCKAAGMNNCTEVVTYVQCLLTGVCQSGDVNVTRQALYDAREKIPAGCAVTNMTTCLGKVSSCFIDHLKQEMNCTTIGTLETCLGPIVSECTVGEDNKTLANAYMTRMTDTYSCKCIKAISSCSTPPLTILENATAEASAKCSAVTELFNCAMPSECNATRTIDNRELSAAMSKAMKAATENQCKDAIPEANATTCPLQLIRCSLIYVQAIHNVTDKMKTCRAAEALGTCLANKTGLCTDAATKNPFTTQYEFIKATCTCENSVNSCIDKAGVVPTDPDVVCPKMQNFSLCVMEARCDLTQKDNALHTAFRWYSNHTATYNCTPPKDKSCPSDLAVCADEAITSMSTKDASAARLCLASQSSVLCVNAANCNQSIASHMNLVSPFTNGTLFRMAGLSCQVPQCTKVYKDVTDCKNAYTSAFTAAGADDTKKCTAKNDMVKCIRGPLCNPYLKAMVEAEYQNLLKVAVNNCDMLLLIPLTSGASTSFNSLLPALVSVLIGYLVVKM